ncbi:MAG: fimbrillin family protein, partial [Muribaculaceae bacterium]|nr:fimbrillin family protein [Muribaculaceae bacterium]
RSGDITTSNLKTFNVYAYTGNGTSPDLFMDNVVVSKSTSNVWTYDPVKYWPSKKAVDFYAFAPASWLDSYTPLAGVPYDASEGTEDIIYAVSPDLTGGAGLSNAQVVFNFRHALSKLTVKMSSSNPELKVMVTNVAIAHLNSKGNFHFPSGSTADAPSDQTVGLWSDQNTPQIYMMHMSQAPDDRITLTSTATDMGTSTVPGSRYLIPQELIWNNNGSGADTYITVMCSIYDTESGAKLWPNANTPTENVVEGSTFGDGLLKFPLSTSAFKEWKPGYHYVYNLVINSNSDMGAIEFGAPAVETFVNVETSYQ